MAAELSEGWEPPLPVGRRAALVVPSLPHPSERASDLASMLGALGQLWVHGVEPDWDGFNQHEERRRIPLPTYPFERQRCWVEPGSLSHMQEAGAARAPIAADREVDDWFWRPIWTPTDVTARSSASAGGMWLVFADEAGLSDRLVEVLKSTTGLSAGVSASTSIVTVRAGGRYERVDDHEYVINPAQREDYVRLFEDLGDRARETLSIAHLWNVGGRSGVERSSDHHQTLGFYSLLYLVQALDAGSANQPVELLVVSNGMQQVLDDDVVEPAKSTSLGPVRVIPREFPHIRCRSVDLDIDQNQNDSPVGSKTLGQIVSEFSADDCPTRSVAYRKGLRYVQSFDRLWPDGRSEPRLRQGGIYLITGGLGGLGLAIAEYLADRFQAKLVLVGRGEASNDVREKLRSIEASVGELLMVAADVTDINAMTDVVRSAHERFGGLNGVVHAAGVLEDGVIALKDLDVAARVLAPKVAGTLVLDSATEGLDLDFMVLFSSTSAALGLPGQVDYTAANAFLNAFARSKRSSKTPTIALGWGPWLDVGMAAGASEHSLSPFLPDSGAAVDHPFLGVCARKTPNEILYRTPYSLEDNWLVREHEIEGFGALIPGTGYLEMARACYEREISGEAMEIRDVFFTAPFRVSEEERRELKTSLRPVNGHYVFLMSSVDSAGHDVEHAQGELAGLSEQPPPSESLRSIRGRCVENRKVSEANPHFKFGPRWNNLKQIEFGPREALASIELPEEFSEDLQRVPLHPALLDMATSCGLPLVEGFDANQEFYVPVSCASVRVCRALSRTLYSHLRLRGDDTEKDFVSFDIDLLDSEGQVLVAIDDFTFRRTTHDSLERVVSTRGDIDPSDQRAGPEGGTSSLHGGIRPTSGVEAFERALSLLSGEPEVLISPQGIDSQFREIDGHDDDRTSSPETSDSLHSEQQSERLRLAGMSSVSQSEAARDTIDEQTRNIWQAILGIDNLGVRDDVFEFGADSLSALKAVSQVKRKWKVKLSVSQLYEHPTVEQLAGLIKRVAESAAA